MSWQLTVAGAIALMGALIHGVVGDRIVRRIDPAALGRNPFGDELSNKLLIRVTWHVTTSAFAVLGGALVAVGLEPDSDAVTGVAYTAGAAYSFWAALTLGAGLTHGGLRSLMKHPAPIAFSVAAILIWWGAGGL